MTSFREHKRKSRGVLHERHAVPALYIPVPDADPVACTVRVWLKSDEMTGASDQDGSAQRTNTEDQLRFRLSQFEASLRSRTGIVSVEAGEAYRIEFLYPVDLGYQTARVTRLSAAEAAGLPLPADAEQSEGGQPVEGIYVYRGSYTYEQTTPSDFWEVEHNLGYQPVVQVFDISGNEMEAVITHTSVNTTEISLSSPMRGEARFV